MSRHRLILYGANGYTGQLILEELIRQNVPAPLLVGRSEDAVSNLADQNKLSFEVSDVQGFDGILKKHRKIELVINAAGPFIETAEQIALSCINYGVHYLDITGEIPVFQQLYDLSDQAKDKGVMLLPGIGFDVVPTDCVAAALKKDMPDATSIILAFAGLGGGTSRGTARTAIRQMANKTWIRHQGKLKQIPWKYAPKKIDFGHFKGTCLPIPWGDLQTAWISTGVPNISVYIPLPKRIRRWIGIATFIGSVPFVKNLVESLISNRQPGPTAAQRAKAQTHVIGIAENDQGNSLRKHLVTPDGYTFTALCVPEVIKRVLNGELKTGFQTPSTAYGEKFVESLPGVDWLSR